MADRMHPGDSPPQLPPSFVARQRLLDSVRSNSTSTITIVHAPAGFGKSAFMAQWYAMLGHQSEPVRWITIDNADRAADAFEYLRCHPLRGTLFLDNFEAVGCEELNELLKRVASAPQAGGHLVVGTRVLPRFVCERLRLQGRIREIGSGDLRLDNLECARLLGAEYSLHDEIDEAEGWPIAIDRLASLYASAEAAVSAPCHVDAWRRHLANYFLEEIVAPLPAELKDFLLDMSILETASPELCDFIRKRTRSAVLIHELQNQHSLLQPSGHDARLLKFHRTVLLAELTSRESHRAAQLHRRASVWYEHRGELIPAVHHAIATGNVELAGKVIERAGGIRLAFRAGPNMARDILGRIPKSLQLSNPRIACLKAFLLLKDGETEGARALAQIVSASRLEAAKDRDLLVDRAMLEIFFALDTGPLEETVDLLTTAAADFDPVAATQVEMVGTIRASFTHQQVGLLHRASVEATRSMHLSSLLEWKYSELYGGLQSGAISVAQGQLQAARSALLRTLECAQRNYAGRDGLHHAARVLLAEVEYLTGRTKDAADLVPQDIREIEQCNCWYDIRAACYSLTLRLARLRGDSAQDIANKLEQILRHLSDHNLQELDRLAIAEASAAMLLLGELREAGALLRRLSIDADTATSPEYAARPWRSDDSIMRALGINSLLAGDPQLSESLAAKWGQRARNESRVPSLISALMLQALAYDAQEKSSEAFACAREAMAHAAEIGAPQAILDLPSLRLRSLLEGASIENSRLAQLAQPVLEYLRAPGPVTGIDASYSGALSERETLVLRGLQRGESNKAIARTMRISENTVKFHAKNVFRKLGISARRDVRTSPRSEQNSQGLVSGSHARQR